MITREQADHIAKLARTIRPAWDELALLNAIHGHQTEPLATICQAVINAATNPRAETPRAVEWSEHWPISPGSKAPVGARRSCPIDGHSSPADNCSQCRSEILAPRHPEPCPNHARWVTATPESRIEYRSYQAPYDAHNCLDCRRDNDGAMVLR